METPCRHAVSAMQYQNLNPKLYVGSCYMREAYKTCYENNVNPIMVWACGQMWMLKTCFQYKNDPGRPKKLRF